MRRRRRRQPPTGRRGALPRRRARACVNPCAPPRRACSPARPRRIRPPPARRRCLRWPPDPGAPPPPRRPAGHGEATHLPARRPGRRGSGAEDEAPGAPTTTTGTSTAIPETHHGLVLLHPREKDLLLLLSSQDLTLPYGLISAYLPTAAPTPRRFVPPLSSLLNPNAGGSNHHPSTRRPQLLPPVGDSVWCDPAILTMQMLLDFNYQVGIETAATLVGAAAVTCTNNKTPRYLTPRWRLVLVPKGLAITFDSSSSSSDVLNQVQLRG